MSLFLWMGLVILSSILAAVGVVIFVEKPKKEVNPSRMGIGIAIGMAIGIPIGIAVGNIATGIAIGSGIGILIGAGMSQKPSINKDTRNNMLVFGTIALALGVITIMTILFSIT